MARFKNRTILRVYRSKMIEDRCEIKIKPDKKYGWKLEVTGCSATLKEIEKNLAPFSNRYLKERMEIKQTKQESRQD